MKKHIIAGMSIIACVALCATTWQQSAKVEDLPAEPVKTAVSAEIEARSEETSQILLSSDTSAHEIEFVTENKPVETEIMAEEKTEPVPQAEPAPRVVSKSEPVSSEPKSGDRAIIDGKPHIWIPGFGWIVDEGGGSIGTTVGNPGDELTGNKVGVIDGGATVGSKGDINKQVGIMGGGTVAEDMYENGHKIGIMGGGESALSSTTPSPEEQPEPTGNVIYIELQPTPTKDSTPPPYKPNTTNP